MTMPLEIKAWIYRKTGIYLARKEESEYLYSDEAAMKISCLTMKGEKYDVALSIVIGLWQSKNGFIR